MTVKTTRISARVSDSTSSALERYVKARGLKKRYVIEQAVRHHLRALRDLPADVIIPPQVLVSRETAELLAGRIFEARTPAPAMRVLFEKK